jgi:hypothetical protein
LPINKLPSDEKLRVAAAIGMSGPSDQHIQSIAAALGVASTDRETAATAIADIFATINDICVNIYECPGQPLGTAHDYRRVSR